MPGLSVIIIARDEADRIRPCLESVRGLADEIVVFDAGSTDATVNICREYTDRVFVTPDWPGDGVQKQRALEQATQEWVLRIDADERVSPELRAEIQGLLAADEIPETAFYIRWATFVFGRYLTRGECGVAHLNLFQREGASFSPVVVHSALTPARGARGRLRGRLLHDSSRSLRHLVWKLNDYAFLDAAERAGEGKTSGLLAALFRAEWRFFKGYILKAGFLDGWRGLLVARVYGNYVFTRHAALKTEAHSSLPELPERE